MSDEKNEDVELSHWRGLEHTRTLVQQARQREELAKKSVMSACAASSDPKVIKAYAVYTESRAMAVVLETGLIHKRTQKGGQS